LVLKDFDYLGWHFSITGRKIKKNEKVAFEG